MMKLTALPKSEPSVKAWAYRMAIGPASILDGVVEILTFSFYGLGAKYWVCMRLAMVRFEAKQFGANDE